MRSMNVFALIIEIDVLRDNQREVIQANIIELNWP
jgi:hypothetical protein